MGSLPKGCNVDAKPKENHISSGDSIVIRKWRPSAERGSRGSFDSCVSTVNAWVNVKNGLTFSVE